MLQFPQTLFIIGVFIQCVKLLMGFLHGWTSNIADPLMKMIQNSVDLGCDDMSFISWLQWEK